ncbi:hypothetical protein Peur_019528 [Populus x canadensis]
MVSIFTPGPNLKSTPKSNPSPEVAFLSSADLLLKNKEHAWTPHVSIFGEHMTSCSQFFFGQPKLLFELVQNAWTSRMDTVKQRIPVLNPISSAECLLQTLRSTFRNSTGHVLVQLKQWALYSCIRISPDHYSSSTIRGNSRAYKYISKGVSNGPRKQTARFSEHMIRTRATGLFSARAFERRRAL